MNGTNEKLLTDLDNLLRHIATGNAWRQVKKMESGAGRGLKRRADALFKLAQKRGLLALLVSGQLGTGWPVLAEYLKKEAERKAAKEAKAKEDFAALVKSKWPEYAVIGVDETRENLKVDEKPTAG